MKRIIIAFAFIASVISINAFAGDIKVNPLVLKNFEQNFSDATDVKWAVENQLYIVEFTINGQHASAYYETNGTLYATGRYLSIRQLPVLLQNSLEKRKDGVVTEVFEVNNAEGTTYYATIQTQTKTITLRSNGLNHWSVYKKK